MSGPLGGRYPAGVAHYRGDTTHMVGEVKGPTTYQSLVVAVFATYDAALDRTAVTFAHCTDDDEALIVHTGAARLDLEVTG